MDIIAQIAVLARRHHTDPRAWATVGGGRFQPHRQGLDKGVKAALVLEIPARPVAIEIFCVKMLGTDRFFNAVVHASAFAKAKRERAGADIGDSPHQTVRSAVIFLISAIARAGFSPLGQAFAQFMMVWQR